MVKKKNKTPALAAKKTAPAVTAQILVRQMHRGVNDIGSWRSALRLADAGNRSKLYSLYTDLLIDGYLSDAIEKRIDAVADAPLSFTVGGKEVDVMKALMDTPEFEGLLRDIMLSRFWGISVDECFFTPEGFDFYAVPRTHIRPKIKQIAIREEDQTGISYAGVDNIIQFGKDDDYGIILRACPYVIYKRGGFGDWSQFVEIFGMPQRIGKYSSTDEISRRALIEALETAGSAPYLVTPKETEIEQTTLSTAGNGKLYDDFRKACNEEILVTILGQTMTTLDGGSHAQGKVHLEVQEGKHKGDRRYTERALNRYFAPLLVNRGLPVAGGKFHFREKAKELSVADISTLSEIVTIPQSWVMNMYNIPLPVGDEPLAGKQPVREQTETEDVEPIKEEKVTRQSDSWYRRLWDFFVEAPDKAGASGPSPRIRLDDTALDGRIINLVAGSGGKAYFAPELFYFIAGELLQAVRAGFSRGQEKNLMDFVYGKSSEAFFTAMEQNVFHFSAAKTLAELEELNELFRESESFGEFYKKAQARVNVFNRAWQKTEYQTAVLTAESAATYQRLAGKTNLFPYWEYRTAGDDKVRPEHAALNGIILPANDPRWDKIWPPNGWNCRCDVLARMRHEADGVDFDEMRRRVDEFFETKEWKSGEAQGWGVNRAKEAEVFTANQMYIRKFPDQAARLMDRVSPGDWGVAESISTLTKRSAASMRPYTGTAAEWWEMNRTTEAGREALRIKDYNGRTLVMGKEAFDTHTTDKVKNRAFRTEYLDAIRETAASPDEVWLGRDRKDQAAGRRRLNNFIMLKFYREVALAVVAKVEKGELLFKSWYVARDKKVRRGLLIKRNKPETGL
jgi:SPP1 gp7 family putative phage head morphogenesis protein